MNSEPSVQPGMGRLIFIYVITFIFAAFAFYALVWAMQTYGGVQYPVAMMLFLLPMVSAIQAGNDFFKQTGRAAGWRTAITFGVLSTLVVLLGIIAIWQAGVMDPLLQAIDPVAYEQGNLLPALSMLLMVIGGLTLFCNTVIFWSSARGGVKREERKAAKAAKAAARRG